MKPTQNFKRSVFAAGIFAAVGSNTTAVASGFAVPEISVAGIGTANALVANPEELGAIPYNPAAMGFHDGGSLAIGATVIGPSFSVTNATGEHDSQGADWLAAPMIQAAVKINDSWYAGLGFNSPFGLETRWAIGTFPALTGTLPSPPLPPGTPASPQPTQSMLGILDFVPALTYRVNEQLSVSAGADIYWAKEAQLNSSLTNLSGDGTGWGFNLSALYARDSWSIGASFHSAATVKVEGNYAPLNYTLLAIGGLPMAQTASLDLNLPSRLQIGARYKISPKLAVELDWARTGWSSFDTIKVVGGLTGTILEDQNQWDDANAYRLGITYQMLPNTRLRFGYSYDQTGQGDDYFSARVPDSDRQLFGVGVGHDLGDGWQLDAGYMYVMFEDRNYSGSRPYNPAEPGEVNGTSAIAGDYKAHANLIGLELSKAF